MYARQLSITKGNSRTFNLTFKDKDEQPYCLKNWVVKFTVKSDFSLPDDQALFQKTITTFPDTTAGTSGSASIPIDPSDTVNANPDQQYDYDITVTTNAGEVYTVMKGKFLVEYKVTDIAGTAGSA